MQRQDRDFKGIWIPKEIWLSDKLSLMEKVLLVEISSLDNERGCFASNRYFAEFFDMSERQIRTHIGSLKAKGFVSVTIQNRYERVIRLVGKYARVKDEDFQKLKNTRHELIHKMTLSKVRG